jgi:hypothetical protein
MAGTSEGARKAAQTRGHESLSEAGRKGGEHSHGGGRGESAKKATPTRGQSNGGRR